MALRDLPSTEMVALTRTWADPTHPDHQVLTTRPLIAPMVPELREAHRDVMAVQLAAEVAQRISLIQAEQNDVDNRFDEVGRGLWFRCKSEEQLTVDPQLESELQEIRTFLLPNGLSTIRMPYRQEAGHCEVVASKLTPERIALLRRLRTHDGDLYEVVIEWLELADRLGQLDHERNGLLPDGDGSTRGANLRARGRWMRIINLVRFAAEVIGEDPDLQEILGRISNAERQAAERRSRRVGAIAQDEVHDGDDDAADGIDDEVEFDADAGEEPDEMIDAADSASFTV